MPLNVTTNISSALRHLGNPDRDAPGTWYDRPAKVVGCLAAAHELRDYPGVEPIVFTESNRFVTDEQLGAVHAPEYLQELLAATQVANERAQRGEPTIVSFGSEAAVSPGTLAAARNAVGASFDMVDVVLKSPVNTGFAVVWPPGHHAEPDSAMGFSYLSTAALAALYARGHVVQVRPGFANRVLVIDIDHHRANGTAAALAGEPDTLLVDLVYRAPYDSHRRRYTDGDVYDAIADRFINAGKEYPYLHCDAEIGAAAHPVVTASNVLTLEFGFSSPEAIMQRFIERGLARIRAFAPDVVIWSLGIDSAQGDALGGMGNLPGSFFTFTLGMRSEFPAARHCGVLEGGYDSANWSRCLQPALLGLHLDPQEGAERSAFFRRNWR